MEIEKHDNNVCVIAKTKSDDRTIKRMVGRVNIEFVRIDHSNYYEYIFSHHDWEKMIFEAVKAADKWWI